MAKKALILYATRAGSTREVAGLIGDAFRGAGMQATVLPVTEAGPLVGYDAVILGSAVRMGRIMPEMRRFVERRKPLLSRFPVAAFTVSLSMKKETPEQHGAAAACLEPVRGRIPLVSEGLFAGKIDYSGLGFISRFLISRMVKAPEGDFLDRGAIESWAAALAKRLLADHTRSTVIEKNGIDRP